MSVMFRRLRGYARALWLQKNVEVGPSMFEEEDRSVGARRMSGRSSKEYRVCTEGIGNMECEELARAV
jgi:hypothetical protein